MNGRRVGKEVWGKDIRTDADEERKKEKSCGRGRRGNPYMEGRDGEVVGGLKPSTAALIIGHGGVMPPPRMCGTDAESARRSLFQTVDFWAMTLVAAAFWVHQPR